MSLTYWTLVVWVKAASYLAPIPPSVIDGPYETLQSCRSAYTAYASMTSKGAHFTCEKHEDEYVEEPKLSDSSLLDNDTCHALQAQGYLISCDLAHPQNNTLPESTIPTPYKDTDHNQW